jgi:hypothetical protein
MPAHPPILLLSGRCVPMGALAAFNMTVSGHLLKPFTAEALVGRCRHLLAEPAEARPPGGRDRRKEPRHSFLGQVTILTERGSPSVSGDVFDISLGGAQLDLGPIPAARFPPGSRLRLSLGLPPGFEVLELQAKVEWNRDAGMGVSFAEASEEARRQLRKRLSRVSED